MKEWSVATEMYPMREIMQLYRSDNGMAVSHTEFPDLFAICRSSEPFLQFQILSLEQSEGSDYGGRYYTWIENEPLAARGSREGDFILTNRENDQRNGSYIVGQIHAANRDVDHYQPPTRVRIEIRRIFLESRRLSIPVVFVDSISMLPKPKNLIVPINAEANEREDSRFNHMLQNQVLNQNNYSYRNPDERDYRTQHPHRGTIWREDYEEQISQLRNARPRTRVVGSVPHTPPTRPRGDESFVIRSDDQAAPSRNTVQLSRFTVNAILNQAILEEMTCPISMARIEKDSAVVTGCQHIFQRESITRWLTDHTTCPVCRARTSIIQIQG